MKIKPKATLLDNLLKKYTPEELAEGLVFPVTLSPEEKALADAELAAARERNKGNLTEETRLKLSLRSLRYKMEDVLSGELPGKQFSFGYFLKAYILLLQRKMKSFAEDISIDPTLLSMLINDKRQPPEYVHFRLEIHSNGFLPADRWFGLAQKQQIEKIKTDKQSRKKQKAFVRNGLSVTL